MSRRCQVLKNKRPQSGYNVSHANNHTKRRFHLNVHRKRIFVPELNRWVRVKVSTSALRLMAKKGPYKVLKDAGLI